MKYINEVSSFVLGCSGLTKGVAFSIPSVKKLVSVGPDIPASFEDFQKGIEKATPFVKPDVYKRQVHSWFGWMAKIQFLPAVLALNAGVMIALVLLTLLLGRVYCSVVCPLGVFQAVSYTHLCW